MASTASLVVGGRRQDVLTTKENGMGAEGVLYGYGSLIEQCLAQGRSVIFDAASFTRRQRDELRELAAAGGSRSTVIYVTTPEEECRARWLANRQTKQRADVREDDFAHVVDNLEPPYPDEDALTYDNSVDVTHWIDQNIQMGIWEALRRGQDERKGNRMKHELGIIRPDYLVEDWPRKYKAFSWLEYVVTVPNPIFIVTTLKPNGSPNANLQSWGLLLGQGNEFISLLAMLNHHHTYQNIKNTREWCINYPSREYCAECFETISVNNPDNDEIADAGFTAEASKTIKTPRIKECLINLECKLLWDRPLYDGSDWQLFCGKVLHAAVDDKAMAVDPAERLRAMQTIYNVRGTVNPLNGEYYGPNTLGLIREVFNNPTVGAQ